MRIFLLIAFAFILSYNCLAMDRPGETVQLYILNRSKHAVDYLDHRRQYDSILPEGAVELRAWVNHSESIKLFPRYQNHYFVRVTQWGELTTAWIYAKKTVKHASQWMEERNNIATKTLKSLHSSIDIFIDEQGKPHFGS